MSDEQVTQKQNDYPRKEQADRLRTFADKVEAGDISAFVLLTEIEGKYGLHWSPLTGRELSFVGALEFAKNRYIANLKAEQYEG